VVAHTATIRTTSIWRTLRLGPRRSSGVWETDRMPLRSLMRRLRTRLTGSRIDTHDRPHPEAETAVVSNPSDRRPFGFCGVPGEESLSSMTPEELLAWENRGVASVARESDLVEAVADERQDLITSLNFPLHWTSGGLSWDYLFDFAVACDLLSPRPDDRVLDLAAGTGWATELLTRLGVRTVSMDLSTEMMRRARQRLASDDRLVFRHHAGFVAARGQELPFQDESFDGILCLNALHHHPDYARALREIFRVLKPGGRAVFSEPGAAHVVAPLSQFRMREETIIEKSVSLPLIRHLARNAGFTRMRVVPLRSSGTYAFDYEASAADDHALGCVWEDTIRHSPREHARFALHKGDEPAADTLLPAHRLVGRLQADIVLVNVTPIIRTGSEFIDSLRITNTGSVTWKARGRRFGGQVTCGLKVLNAQGTDVLREDLGRTPLSGDVAPGEHVEITMRVAALLEPGDYRLRYDMVVEGVTWFEFQGSACPTRQLTVTQ
jgi:SAM-dependent methyltransferase